MNYFATGTWGMVAQLSSLLTLVTAFVLLVLALCVKQFNPVHAAKLKKIALWAIALIPITFLIWLLIIMIGISIYGF